MYMKSQVEQIIQGFTIQNVPIKSYYLQPT